MAKCIIAITKIGAVSYIQGEVMILQKNQIEQPFMFWLVRELFSTDRTVEEELKPISNREFYTWMGLLSAALLIYGAVFRLFAA